MSELDKQAAGSPIAADFLELSGELRTLAAKMGVVAEIHKKDFIFKFVARKWKGDQERAVANYYQLGDYSAKLARDILGEVVRVRKVLKEGWTPGRVLDFASGYGCVSRHLSRELPESTVSTCDIHSEAVAFNSSVLGLASTLSSSTPERLELPPQDLIFALSFFSHMPKTTWVRWLQALASSLAPGGVLVFTANGYVTDKFGNIQLEVMDDGFGFRAESEQGDLKGEQYGITISYPRWVFGALDQCPNLRLARFQEGLWWAVQDTYVCIRQS